MKETKVICISCKGNNKVKLSISNELIEQVKQFKYYRKLVI